MKIAYTIVVRETEGETKSFWVRVGVAFENKDGSINVRLDALPVNGTLQLREYEARDGDDDRGSEPPAESRGSSRSSTKSSAGRRSGR